MGLDRNKNVSPLYSSTLFTSHGEHVCHDDEVEYFFNDTAHPCKKVPFSLILEGVRIGILRKWVCLDRDKYDLIKGSPIILTITKGNNSFAILTAITDVIKSYNNISQLMVITVIFNGIDGQTYQF